MARRHRRSYKRDAFGRFASTSSASKFRHNRSHRRGVLNQLHDGVNQAERLLDDVSRIANIASTVHGVAKSGQRQHRIRKTVRRANVPNDISSISRGGLGGSGARAHSARKPPRLTPHPGHTRIAGKSRRSRKSPRTFVVDRNGTTTQLRGGKR